MENGRERNELNLRQNNVLGGETRLPEAAPGCPPCLLPGIRGIKKGIAPVHIPTVCTGI